MGTADDRAGGSSRSDEPGADARRLNRFRRVLDRAIDAVDREVARLLALDASDEPAKTRMIADEVRLAQKCLVQLLEHGRELDGMLAPPGADMTLDLEAARAEIDSRLARLAERG